MAISPLEIFSPAAALTEAGPQKKPIQGSTVSFDSLLGSLRDAAGTPSRAGQQAAADLFRIEMMQHSLALSGACEAPPANGLTALEALLSNAPALPGPIGQASRAARSGSEQAAAPVGTAALQATGTEEDAGAIETTASHYLGIPYRFGGQSAHGIDCSSFVQQVFREHQVELPRTAREQSMVGNEVAPGDLRKGDLVFFHTYASYPSHVGIYLGDGKMIHASSGKGEVTVSDLNSDYYRSRYLGAKRVV